MITISISAETYTIEGMAETLRYIANQIDQGYTQSYDPGWNIEGEEELNDMED